MPPAHLIAYQAAIRASLLKHGDTRQLERKIPQTLQTAVRNSKSRIE
jgi:hypothetical protein